VPAYAQKIRIRENFPSVPRRTAMPPTPAQRLESDSQNKRVLAQRSRIARLFGRDALRQRTPSAADVLALQRLVGNRATNRLLRAQDATVPRSIAIGALPLGSLPAILQRTSQVIQRGGAGSKTAERIPVEPIDQAFRAKLEEIQLDLPEGVTVFVYAVGSYGRGELQGNSDLDYYIVVQGGEEASHLKEQLQRALGRSLEVGEGEEKVEWDLECEGANLTLLQKANNSLLVTGRFLWKKGSGSPGKHAEYGGVDPRSKAASIRGDLGDALKGAVSVKTGLYQPFMKALILLGVEHGEMNPATIVERLADETIEKAYKSIQASRQDKEPREATRVERKAIEILLEKLK
jgi:predicted nucleotidyltransferase